MDEIWKDIYNSNGLYLINKNGVIINTKTNKECKAYVNSKGYMQLKLKLNHKWETVKLHRIIALSFLENPDKKPFINHIDGNKLNNSIKNLEWVNNRENVCHGKDKINSYSKYIGVSWHKLNKKWISQIRNKGKMIFLGYYDNQEDAYKSRIKYEKDNLIINKYL